MILINKQCGQCGHLNQKWDKGITGFFAKLMRPNIQSERFCNLKIESTEFDVYRVTRVPLNPKERNEFFKDARHLCAFFSIDWDKAKNH